MRRLYQLDFIKAADAPLMVLCSASYLGLGSILLATRTWANPWMEPNLANINGIQKRKSDTDLWEEE